MILLSLKSKKTYIKIHHFASKIKKDYEISITLFSEFAALKYNTADWLKFTAPVLYLVYITATLLYGYMDNCSSCTRRISSWVLNNTMQTVSFQRRLSYSASMSQLNSLLLLRGLSRFSMQRPKLQESNIDGSVFHNNT